MVRTNALWLVPVFASALFQARPTFADDPTPAQMMEQIRQLQAKVEKLEANQATRSSAPVAPANSSAAVEADAQRHSQFLDDSNPFTAGWDGKQFILKSENGDFTFHSGLVLDVRNMTSYRQSIPSK